MPGALLHYIVQGLAKRKTGLVIEMDAKRSMEVLVRPPRFSSLPPRLIGIILSQSPSLQTRSIDFRARWRNYKSIDIRAVSSVSLRTKIFL